MIYKVDGGYVISSCHVWCPGVYDTERTARYAFRFDDGDLRELQESIAPAVITMEMLRTLRKRLTPVPHPPPPCKSGAE